MNARNPAELIALLRPGQRLLGIDPGTKTLGLALSDPSRRIASPLRTIARVPFRHVRDELAALAADEEIGGIVLGLPLHLDGGEGRRAQAARALAVNLERALALPVALWDERWSTAAVTRTLRDADAPRRRRKQAVDTMAAAYILQGALDRARAPCIAAGG